MARKFLYGIAILAALIMLGTIAIRAYWQDIVLYAFVPPSDFDPGDLPPAPDYALPESWAAMPGAMGAAAPEEEIPADERLPVGVFFVHPTTYFSSAGWNAAIDDKNAGEFLDDVVVKYEVSIFNLADQVYAPRYRQAALAFAFRDNDNSRRALDLAYQDVARAFDRFLTDIGDSRPFIVAGHSQGARHLRRLLAERIAGTPLVDRMVAAYVIGTPLSMEHDIAMLPGIGLCRMPAETGCIAAWQTYAEGAEPKENTPLRAAWPALDGTTGETSTQACVNPVTWRADTAISDKSAHLGLVTRILPELPLGDLMPGALTARCGNDGYLFVNVDEPQRLARFQMMSGNLHFYDMTLFYADIRQNVATRVAAFLEGTGP